MKKTPVVRRTEFGDYQYTICFPVFSKYKIQVIFTDDLEKSVERRFNEVNDYEDTDGLHHKDKPNDCISYLLYRMNTDVDVYTHETWHAFQAMMRWVGASPSADTEITAYHLGYIMKETHEFRKRLGA
jgi:hypothetical protein